MRFPSNLLQNISLCFTTPQISFSSKQKVNGNSPFCRLKQLTRLILKMPTQRCCIPSFLSILIQNYLSLCILNFMPQPLSDEMQSQVKLDEVKQSLSASLVSVGQYCLQQLFFSAQQRLDILLSLSLLSMSCKTSRDSGLRGGLLLIMSLLMTKLYQPEPQVSKINGFLVQQAWLLRLQLCPSSRYNLLSDLSQRVMVLLRWLSVSSSLVVLLVSEGWWCCEQARLLWKKDLMPLLIFPKFLLSFLNLAELRSTFINLSLLANFPLYIWYVQQVLVRISETIDLALINLFPIRVFQRDIRQSFLQLLQAEFKSPKVLYSRWIWLFLPRMLSLGYFGSLGVDSQFSVWVGWQLCEWFNLEVYLVLGRLFLREAVSLLSVALCTASTMSLSLRGWLILYWRSQLVIRYWYSSVIWGSSFCSCASSYCEVLGRMSYYLDSVVLMIFLILLWL